MDVRLDCPTCKAPMSFSVGAAPVPAACSACERSISPFAPTVENVVERCAACGEYRLYRQKDLNPRVGLAVILSSAVISLALLPFSPLAAYAVLFLLAAIDLGLYRMLPAVIICYRCQAKHRRFAPQTKIEPFDLLTADLIDQQLREQGDR